MNIRHKFTSKKFLIVLKYLRYEYKTSLKNRGGALLPKWILSLQLVFLQVHKEAIHYNIKPLIKLLEETPRLFGELVGRQQFLSRVPHYKENIEVSCTHTNNPRLFVVYTPTLEFMQLHISTFWMII